MVPLVTALIGAGTTLYTHNQSQQATKKANAQADAIEQAEKDKLKAFRDRLSSGGRGLLGFLGDDNLGVTLGS